MCKIHKSVAHQEEWGRVCQELADENLKLASYDNTMIGLLGNIEGKLILDYGAGPGVLALALIKMGADTRVWDISPEMREQAARKITAEYVYDSIDNIPDNVFDVIICNLVLCIVPEDEVRQILRNMSKMLSDDGYAYVGFCNPLLFNVKETNLDFRIPTGASYEDNHEYKKIKKEGGYEIVETHRPIEWYQQIFSEEGFHINAMRFTPDYKVGERMIQDFVIFELALL